MFRYRYRWQLELLSHLMDRFDLTGLRESFHLLAGYSPVFVGLHEKHTAADGRNTENSTHTWHNHRDLPTIVMINECKYDRYTHDSMLHELAHVLHSKMGAHDFKIMPISEYAAKDKWEAFACAYTSWAYQGQSDYWHRDISHVWKICPEAIPIFEQVCRR